MPRNRTVELYRQFYTDMHLERGGLFESVRTRYGCRTALYPGCSFHITPSFYIPHVVYVDSSPAARDFFADQEALLQFIRRKKRYPESAFLRYIHQDFHLPLPLQLDNFDLLISIYAGGIAQDCKRYLKRGGILLTDNHHQEAAQAGGAPDLEFIAVVNQKGKTYRISEEGLENYFVLRKRGGRNPASSFSADPEYILTAEYYIFRRVAKKSEPA
jgi:hypothetical protein